MLKIAITALALLTLGLSGLLLYRIRSPWAAFLYPLKVLAGSLAHVLAATGALSALGGLLIRTPVAPLAGALGAACAALYLRRVTAPGAGLQEHLGPLAQCQAPPPRQRTAPARPRWQRDVPFWTVPGCPRPLLCDLWLPPAGVAPSGLGLVYFHSSSWHLADKDLWTRPFFRHLACQGHVVMDVAYRLCPEVDLLAMQGDARRAIAWLKANAARYGVSPRHIVAAGASAGAHLALLAAYTPGHRALTPGDLQGADTSVRAVVSCYGLTDLRAFYRHIGSVLPGNRLFQALAGSPLLPLLQRVGDALPGGHFAGQAYRLGHLSRTEMMAGLLGGQPDEVPALYDLASPIAHAGPHCPATLLIQGEDDVAVPAAATRALARQLAAAGVPVACVVLPHTDHLFDLILPRLSPAARVARRHVDRFLSLLG